MAMRWIWREIMPSAAVSSASAACMPLAVSSAACSSTTCHSNAANRNAGVMGLFSTTRASVLARAAAIKATANSPSGLSRNSSVIGNRQ
jgi:predicted CxxxxCH...CXXCH cytochrome family protein